MKDMFVFLLSILLVVTILVVFTGCAEKTVYVDRIVKVDVPVRCVAPDVNQSVKGKNDADSLLNIIKERDELRIATQSCK
jgi:predicted component of type VI protein secretion system